MASSLIWPFQHKSLAFLYQNRYILTYLIKGFAKVSTREQNERKFGEWEKLANGGRQYFREIIGRYGWRARYVKEVDADEATLSFRQEIYDDKGNLTEIHEKFPIDKGHQKI